MEIVFQDKSRGFTRAAEPAFQGTGSTFRKQTTVSIANRPKPLYGGVIQWPVFKTHAGQPFMTTPTRPHRGDQPREICATAVARCAEARARPAALSGQRTRLAKTPGSHLSNLTLSSDHQPNLKTSNVSNDPTQPPPPAHTTWKRGGSWRSDDARSLV